MRIALIVLVGVAAPACKDLPDIPVGVCGNHILEAGEDCDSSDATTCAPPGSPDACHAACTIGDGGQSSCGAGEVCGDSGFCRPTTNVCGNLVVDPGEDCDSGTSDPTCGFPAAGAHACRFLCDGPACPTGYFCRRDQICRAPTGTYTLGPGVGLPEDFFSLLDVNADGYPDLVERGLSRRSPSAPMISTAGSWRSAKGRSTCCPPMALQSGSTHLNPPSTTSR